jgi:hypothetical protein
MFLHSFCLKTLVASTVVGTVTFLSAISASAAICYVYAVNIQGIVTSNYGSQQFSVEQFAIWRDTPLKTNPVDFYLASGQDLNASPQFGRIELMTNSFFAQNLGVKSARYDLAGVSITNVVQFTLNNDMSFVLPPSNIFVATGVSSSPGGLGGIGFAGGWGAEFAKILNSAPILNFSYFIPRQGSGYFYFPNNNTTNIAGKLDIIGTAVDNPSSGGRYTADFSGKYVKSQLCN